jgi:hypothetical protein
MSVRSRVLLPLLALLGFSHFALGQSNLIPGTDVHLAKMDLITQNGHAGSFPNGLASFSLATTACNKGTVKVPWDGPMKENHPLISFMVTRELDGRFEQISDYSYVKHGFFALTSDYCNVCQEGPGGGGDVLGIGCSDTYKASNNGDQYYLGPPSEIDPWLGMWDNNCSFFDQGLAPVPPFDCDGARSLSLGQVSTMSATTNRIRIQDEDLNVAGASFFYQGFYTIRGEPESDRRNNIGHRQFTPSWNGSEWSTPSVGGVGKGDFVNGPVLDRWTGASVTSVKNGNDDGRVYVAVKVTGPVDGKYRYEYAVQNRDNFRGVNSFSLPICSGARVFNAGFKDVDIDAGNDWSIAVGSSDITWSGGTNALRWNSIYNFWFESDAAPVNGSVSMNAADPGPGLNTLVCATQVPQALYNVYLGDGCAPSAAPELFASGSAPQATIGNPNFELTSTGNQPNQLQLLFMSGMSGTVPLGSGCNQYFLGQLGGAILQVGSGTTDASGKLVYAIPVPANPALEGFNANLQGLSVHTGGALLGQFDLTNGLRVRVGDALPTCP